jgi:hypothetical protein
MAEILNTVFWLVIGFCAVFFGGLIIVNFFAGGSHSNSDTTQKDTAQKISLAIDYKDPVVKNFANSQVQHSSSGKYNIAQICDVWQSMYNRWTYVSDPPNFDYFTSASDSIQNGLKGNCADYAILNAAVIKSIGGSSRIITTCAPGGKICHAYAEVLLTDNPTTLKNDATYICHRYRCDDGIHYHVETTSDGDKHYWLNLDWQSNYPGGKFYVDDGEHQVYYPNGAYTNF